MKQQREKGYLVWEGSHAGWLGKVSLEKVTFELKPRSEGASHATAWE